MSSSIVCGSPDRVSVAAVLHAASLHMKCDPEGCWVILASRSHDLMLLKQKASRLEDTAAAGPGNVSEKHQQCQKINL